MGFNLSFSLWLTIICVIDMQGNLRISYLKDPMYLMTTLISLNHFKSPPAVYLHDKIYSPSQKETSYFFVLLVCNIIMEQKHKMAMWEKGKAMWRNSSFQKSSIHRISDLNYPQTKTVFQDLRKPSFP
jgi:hypothetical protein